MTSVDGINWIGRSVPSDKVWQEITYGIPSQGIYAGQGLFVVVPGSTSSGVMTSPDGVNWTYTAFPTTPNSSNNFRDITYGGGIFVATAVGGANRIMYSRDGINWTAISVTTFDGGLWSGVAYGNGKFVAVSYNGPSVSNGVITSSNGINWALVTTALPSISQNWHGITYGVPLTGQFAGTGLFVSCGFFASGTSNIMTSTDGNVWTVRTTPTTTNLYRVKYGNGYFIATGNTLNPIISTDGITWTLKQNVISGMSLTYGIPSSGPYAGQGMFITVGVDGTNRVSTATFIDTYTTNSVAIGNGAIANGTNSVAIGVGAIANGSNQITLGTTVESVYIPGTLTTTGTLNIGRGFNFINVNDNRGNFSGGPFIKTTNWRASPATFTHIDYGIGDNSAGMVIFSGSNKSTTSGKNVSWTGLFSKSLGYTMVLTGIASSNSNMVAFNVSAIGDNIVVTIDAGCFVSLTSIGAY
jgi:hypothetical protein